MGKRVHGIFGVLVLTLGDQRRTVSGDWLLAFFQFVGLRVAFGVFWVGYVSVGRVLVHYNTGRAGHVDRPEPHPKMTSLKDRHGKNERTKRPQRKNENGKNAHVFPNLLGCALHLEAYGVC